MQTTLLAQIIGPTLATITISFFLNPKYYKKVMADFMSHKSLTYLSGFLAMIIGLIIIISNENTWEFSATGLITLFGWEALAKGLVLLITPEFFVKISKKMLKSETLLNVSLSLALVAGIYLSYVGYFA